MIRRMVLFLLVSARIGMAERIWMADFESYTAGQSLTLDASGGNDKFTSLSAPSVGLTVVDGSLFGLTNGLSLRLTNQTAQAKSLRLNNVITASHKLVVVSFDRVKGDGTLSLSVNAVSAANTRPHGVLALSATNAPSRVTMVINLTGGDVTLANGSVLAHNSVANYYKVGTDYFGYTSQVLTDSPTGFMLTTGATLGDLLFDNFALWVTDGSVDTVGGVSVMALNFGDRVTAPVTPRSLGLFILR